MPMCHRCRRLQAGSELRRTTLGYVCLDNGPGTRCFALARDLRLRERAERRRAEDGSGVCLASSGEGGMPEQLSLWVDP
jgi:hypothetical protein